MSFSIKRNGVEIMDGSNRLSNVFFWFVVATGMMLTQQLAGAENMVRNSSFELGLADWALVRISENTAYIDAVKDVREKIHGASSLKIFNPDADTIRMFSHEIKVKSGSSYTVSFYAKSSVPVKIMAGALGGKPKPSPGHDFPRKSFLVTKQWQRFSMTFKAASGYEYYSVFFLWGNVEPRRSKATVWLDAVMLSGDCSADYVPRKACEAALSLNKRVVFRDEHSVEVTVNAVNYSTAHKNYTLKFDLNDLFHKNIIKSYTESFTMKPGEVQSKRLDIPVNKFGSYSLSGPELWARDFVVIGKVPKGKIDVCKDFVCGVDESFNYIYPDGDRTSPYWGYGKSLDDYLEFERNAGIRVLRSGNTGCAFDWKTLEPVSGSFNWETIDLLEKKAAKLEMVLMPVLGNMPYLRHRGKGISTTRLPEWLVKRSKLVKHNSSWDFIQFPLEDWSRYVQAWGERFKKDIPVWEIFNEPNVVMSAEEYVKYLKSAWQILKSADSQSQIIGFCSTGDLSGRMIEFIIKSARLGALNYCDAVSFHPYKNRSGLSAEKGIFELQKALDSVKPGLSLWNSELYYLGEGETPANNNAALLITRMLTDLGCGVKQSFDLGSNHLLSFELRPHWEDVPIRYYGVGRLVPNQMYAALNTTARLFEGARPVKRLEWPQAVRCYLFEDRHGEAIAACWRLPEAPVYSVKIPDGLQLFDLFGNELDSKQIKLEDAPYYIRGPELEKKLSRAVPVPEDAVAAEAASYGVENGKYYIALQLHNLLSSEQRGSVKLLEAGKNKTEGKAVSFLLPPKTVQIIHLPVIPQYSHRLDAVKASFEVNGKVVRLDIPRRGVNVPGQRKQLKNRGNVRIGARNWKGPKDLSFSFKVITDLEFLQIDVDVTDNKRGENGPRLWDRDCVEIFIDSFPGSEIKKQSYTDNCFRLYVAPATANSPAGLETSRNLSDKDILWKANDSADGYHVSVKIPWRAINLKGPVSFAFDIAVDDSDGMHRNSQMIWSGSSQNHILRCHWGLLNL